MAISDLLDRLTLTRRFVKSTERIASALEAQNVLLGRIADHIAPVLPTVSEEDLRSSGPEYRQQGQLARHEEWVEGFIVRMGRFPSEEEREEWVREDEERESP